LDDGSEAWQRSLCRITGTCEDILGADQHNIDIAGNEKQQHRELRESADRVISQNVSLGKMVFFASPRYGYREGEGRTIKGGSVSVRRSVKVF
jgi:hypothetical protein